MKFNYLSLALLFFIGLISFTSCDKENLDTNTTEVNENTPEVINCNLEVYIEQEGVDLLTAYPADGTAPYAYVWSTGETTSSIEVPEGTYSVTVTDADGCIAEHSITIDNNGSDCQDFWIDWAAGNETATVFVGGGTAPYSITWSNGEVATGVTEHTINGVPGETYSVVVVDNNGCTETASITIPNGTDPCNSFEMSVQETIPNSGNLYANAFGGTSPYAFVWSTGETTQSINVLSAGTYSATVVDATGCTLTESITISEPDPCSSLGIEFSPADPTNDMLTAYVYGGSEPYAFNWSTGETTATISFTAGNAYTLTVTDANGCVVTDTIQL